MRRAEVPNGRAVLKHALHTVWSFLGREGVGWQSHSLSTAVKGAEQFICREQPPAACNEVRCQAARHADVSVGRSQGLPLRQDRQPLFGGPHHFMAWCGGGAP